MVHANFLDDALCGRARGNAGLAGCRLSDGARIYRSWQTVWIRGMRVRRHVGGHDRMPNGSAVVPRHRMAGTVIGGGPW